MQLQLGKALLDISPDEVTFARRGFWCGEPSIRQRLEHSGGAFVRGYQAALEDDEPDPLALRLDGVEVEFRGFAFEGAAMGLALLDGITPWKRNRLRAFMGGPGGAHIYMMHIGAGCALARLPWRRWTVQRQLGGLDPLLRWLVLDGYGFHEGYFHPDRSLVAQAVPARLSGYARRAFDQGLGRSLWFVDGANVIRIPATIAAFPPARHADLWSGVGLACAYAGGAEQPDIEVLLAAAGPYAPHVAQGAVFAAKARQRAANPALHTDLACRVLCGMGAEEAARIADEALEGLSARSPVLSPLKEEGKRREGDREENQRDGAERQTVAEPAYEAWRGHIRRRLSRQAVTT